MGVMFGKISAFTLHPAKKGSNGDQ